MGLLHLGQNWKSCYYLFWCSNCPYFFNWIFLLCPHHFWALPHFLAQDVLRLSCTFSAPALELAVSPKSPVSLSREWNLETTHNGGWQIPMRLHHSAFPDIKCVETRLDMPLIAVNAPLAAPEAPIRLSSPITLALVPKKVWVWLWGWPCTLPTADPAGGFRKDQKAEPMTP